MGKQFTFRSLPYPTVPFRTLLFDPTSFGPAEGGTTNSGGRGGGCSGSVILARVSACCARDGRTPAGLGLT